jgi:hypothetical protein
MKSSTLKKKSFRLLVIGGLTFAVSLSSCDKDADPTLIKVSSTAIPGLTPANPGPGTGTTPPSTGTTPGTGTNTGDGGVAIGESNIIIVKIGTTSYTLVNPADLLTFEVNSSPLVITGIGAGTDVSEKSFALTSGATKAGLFDIKIFAAKVNGIKYVATEGDGKVNYTKFDVTGEVNGVAKTGTLQGTYDVLATDINTGNEARIVGSFNITQ